MADENKEVISSTVSQTSEVIDQTGASVSSHSALADIFDKIDAGKAAGKSSADLLAEVTAKPDPVVVDDKPKDDSAQAPVVDDKPKETEETKVEETKTPTRQELFEKTEPKPAEKPVEKPVEKDEVSEDELQVLPHDKPKTAKRISALLAKVKEWETTATTTKKEADEKAQKLAELEEQLKKTTTVDPKVKEELDRKEQELAQFRRRYELDKDPEVKTKFDSRVESAENAIVLTLTKFRGGDEMAKLVKDEGGWAKLAESGKIFTMTDGKRVTGAELAESVYNALPMTDRRAIDAALMEQIQTKRDKDRFFEEQTKTAVDYFKKRDEEAARSSQEYNKQVEDAKNEIANWQKEIVDKNDFLKPKEIPANATPEERKAIEDHNGFTKEMHELLKASLAPKGLKGMLEVVFDSVRYYDERRRSALKDSVIEQQAAQIKELQEKFDKFKNAGRSTIKSGSIASGSTGSAPAEKQKPASLEEALAALEAGVDPKEIL